ncbi:MAG: hypothetical protein ACR2GH_22610 [Pseudonocardia sp.]
MVVGEAGLELRVREPVLQQPPPGHRLEPALGQRVRPPHHACCPDDPGAGAPPGELAVQVVDRGEASAQRGVGDGQGGVRRRHVTAVENKPGTRQHR